MTDLISRQAAQAINVLPKFYREYQTGNLDDAYEKGWEDAMFSLNALPTIEPFSTSGYVTTVTDLPPVVYAEQKRGTWKKAERDGCVTYSDAYLQCSECGKAIFLAKTMNFCPHCGAKMIMRGENEN